MRLIPVAFPEHVCYCIAVAMRNLHGGHLPFADTKEVVRMKNNDFISLSGWLFSLLSLLIAVYMLGKGI